jgi:hypothetical protein
MLRVNVRTLDYVRTYVCGAVEVQSVPVQCTGTWYCTRCGTNTWYQYRTRVAYEYKTRVQQNQSQEDVILGKEGLQSASINRSEFSSILWLLGYVLA